MKPKIILIVAASKYNRVIGDSNNNIPWPRLKFDMQHFRAITLGYPVIMGRVTFETFPQKDGFPNPLPNRTNIVVTRNIQYKVPKGVLVAQTLIEACIHAQKINSEKICIIGGEQIYQLALPAVDEIFYTEVNLDVKGTTYFPPIPESFSLLSKEEVSEETPDKKIIEYSIQHWAI
jgi:dihydrofolate reductase